MMRLVRTALTVIAAAVPAVGLHAHHSFFGRFDTSTTIELEGLVTRVVWRNPAQSDRLGKTVANGGKIAGTAALHRDP